MDDDFLLADHLDPNARADSRTDYRGAFYIWRCSRDGWEWYIALPADTSPLTEAVKRFIDSGDRQIVAPVYAPARPSSVCRISKCYGSPGPDLLSIASMRKFDYPRRSCIDLTDPAVR